MLMSATPLKSAGAKDPVYYFKNILLSRQKKCAFHLLNRKGDDGQQKTHFDKIC